MQRVYRGERAQRGRFREFYQCDIDVIGKDALSVRYDAELPAVIHAVFSELAIGAVHHPAQQPQADARLLRGPGHRRRRAAGAGAARGRQARQARRGPRARHADRRRLRPGRRRGRDASSTSSGSARPRMPTRWRSSMRWARATTRLREGVAELREVLELVRALGVPETDYALNFSIARGLDYYTGTVYETTLDDYPQIGSICSGGRYENLASHYTKSKLPGVGISIGLTRLFWQLREAGLIDTAASTVHVLVTQMDDALAAALPGDRQRAAPRRAQHRGGAGVVQARQAVPVRRPRRHPLRGGARRGRDRQGHGDGEGSAPSAISSKCRVPSSCAALRDRSWRRRRMRRTK